jgi:hypothetical protein
METTADSRLESVKEDLCENADVRPVLQFMRLATGDWRLVGHIGLVERHDLEVSVRVLPGTSRERAIEVFADLVAKLKTMTDEEYARLNDRAAWVFKSVDLDDYAADLDDDAAALLPVF